MRHDDRAAGGGGVCRWCVGRPRECGLGTRVASLVLAVAAALLLASCTSQSPSAPQASSSTAQPASDTISTSGLLVDEVAKACPHRFDLVGYMKSHYTYGRYLNSSTSPATPLAALCGVVAFNDGAATATNDGTALIISANQGVWADVEQDLNDAVAKNYTGQRGRISLGPTTGIFEDNHGIVIEFPAPPAEGAIVYSVIGNSMTDVQDLAQTFAAAVYRDPSTASVPTPTSSSDPVSTKELTCPDEFDLTGAAAAAFTFDETSPSDAVAGKSVGDHGQPEPDDFSCTFFASDRGQPVLAVTLRHDRDDTWTAAQQRWTAFDGTKPLNKKGTITLGPVQGLFTEGFDPTATGEPEISFPAPPGSTGVYSLLFSIGDSDSDQTLATTFATWAYRNTTATTSLPPSAETTPTTASPPATGTTISSGNALTTTSTNHASQPFDVATLPCDGEFIVVMHANGLDSSIANDPQGTLAGYPDAKLGAYGTCVDPRHEIIYYGPFQTAHQAWQERRDRDIPRASVVTLAGSGETGAYGGICELAATAGPPPVLSIDPTQGIDSGNWVFELTSVLNQKGLLANADLGRPTLTPAVVQAIEQYQSRLGVVPDGQVGPKTWAKILADNCNE